jgi:alpha-tubulin suppressor-like RCC1 family protein
MQARGGTGRLVGRWVLAVVLLVSLPLAAGPASAAGHAQVTRLVMRATPATVHIGSTLVISGSVSPRIAGVPVVLQRLVGNSWHTVGKHKLPTTGAFTFSLKAPAVAAKWVLRVTREASATTKAGVSATVHVRVVKALFVVKAAAAKSVAAGAPIVVTGSVRPKATGSVVLQRLVGRTWHNLATARLSAASTFRFATLRPTGSYRLRVMKAYTATLAGGVSPGVSVSVLAAPLSPGPPSVTTTRLPSGTAGVAYTTTLTATGGTPPYLWTSAGLPAGLTFSSTGTISGAPTSAGASTVTVTVADTGGRAGSAALTLTVAAAPRSAGRLWAWGNNSWGQLGNNSTTDANVLVPVTGLTSVTAVVGGALDAYALRSDGTVWAWGFNLSGQLGNATNTSSSVPVQVNGVTSVSEIAAGGQSAYALKSDGTVWAWGNNAFGQLGNNSTTDSSNAVQVSGLTGVTAIAGGAYSGYALKADGRVWAWGYNSHGELGNNSSVNSAVPVAVNGLTGVAAIAAGSSTAYALLTDSTVRAWGNNTSGGLGNNTTTESRVPVEVSGLNGVTAIAGGETAGYALRADGTVWDWGLSSFVPVEVSGLTSVTAIAAGRATAYALRADGYVWAWGDNTRGQLGNGSNALSSSVPVQASGLTGVIGLSSGPTSSSGYAIEPG